MANTINVETELDGERNLVLQIGITGDGTGDETNTALVDISAFNADEASLVAVTGDLTGFSATLEWDATANEIAQQVPEGHSFVDYGFTGGNINRAGAGKTGDIDISTVGLGLGDKGSIRLELRKKYD